MIMARPATGRVAFELHTLTYDEMMSFAQVIGEALGVLGRTLTGMTEDELTTEVIAKQIAGWVDSNLEDEDRAA
jgi:hypothetical protein